MLAPFPWELGGASTRMLMTLTELVIWWYLFFLGVVPGVIYCLRRRLKQTASLMLFVLSFGLVYSLIGATALLYARRRFAEAS